METEQIIWGIVFLICYLGGWFAPIIWLYQEEKEMNELFKDPKDEEKQA